MTLDFGPRMQMILGASKGVSYWPVLNDPSTLKIVVRRQSKHIACSELHYKKAQHGMLSSLRKITR